MHYPGAAVENPNPERLNNKKKFDKTSHLNRDFNIIHAIYRQYCKIYRR